MPVGFDLAVARIMGVAGVEAREPRFAASAIREALARYAVVAYFVLTIAISWSLVALIAGVDQLPLTWERFEAIAPALALGNLLGPCGAGILLTALVDGRTGLREVSSQLRKWRVGGTWYLVALAPSALVAAVALVTALIQPDWASALFRTDDKLGLLANAIIAGVFVGVFEEIGWTGFATRKLLSRRGVLSTALLIGVVWGTWHFPLFWEADTFTGGLPFTILLVRLYSWLPATRILLVTLYQRTGSVFITVLSHASLTATQVMFAPVALTGGALIVNILIGAALFWLLAVLVIRKVHR